MGDWDPAGQLSAILRGQRAIYPSDEAWMAQNAAQIEAELLELSGLQALDPRELELYIWKVKYEAARSPIYQLPPEILLDIFQWTSCAYSNDILVIQNAPWSLAQVCGLWRNLVLSIPSFWSTIIVFSPFPKHAIDIMVECLSRSRDQALYISITQRDQARMAPIDDLVLCTQLLQLLSGHSNRWKMIQLDILDIHTILSILSMEIQGQLACLEEVYFLEPPLSFLRASGLQSPIANIDRALLGAPRIRRADMRSHFLLEMSCRAINLTHFAATLYDFPSVERLMAFPSLEECHLCGPHVLDSPIKLLTHTNLRRICVEKIIVLTALRLPSLTSLSFFSCKVEPDDVDVVTNFVKRSGCKLIVLAISFLPLILHLDPFFRGTCIGNLTHFCVPFSSHPTGQHCSAQVMNQMSNGILPNMEVLTIVVYFHGRDFSSWPAEMVQALMSMLSYRTDQAKAREVVRLRHLRLCLCPDDAYNVLRLEGLARLETGGLFIEHNRTYGTGKHWTGPFWFLEDDIPK